MEAEKELDDRMDPVEADRHLKLVAGLVLLSVLVVFLLCAASAALGFWAGVTKSPPIIVNPSKSGDISMTPHIEVRPSVQVDVPPTRTVVENKVVVPEAPPPVVNVNVPQQPAPIVNVQAPVVKSDAKGGNSVMYDPALHAKVDQITQRMEEEGKLLPPPKGAKP
jgi:hypothetical protein